MPSTQEMALSIRPAECSASAIDLSLLGDGFSA
jgi:hypothetical protein